MPADLTTHPDSPTIAAILAHLTGAPPSPQGDQSALDLADAAALYDRAGRSALDHQGDTDWWHVNLEFTHWPEAADLARKHLAPHLLQAEADGLLASWWFIRKHPCWRIRLHPTARRHRDLRAWLAPVLDWMVTTRQLTRWWTGIYEPEIAAFGGETSMDLAHALFYADSRAILVPQPDLPLGLREESVLLCTAMLRAAGLEWYEQGDVWDRVLRQRPLASGQPAERIAEMTSAVARLLAADTTTEGAMFGPGGPMAGAVERVSTFAETGRRLGTAAREGTLERGLRLVLSYHIIFHWNRCGLSDQAQSALAHCAKAAVLGEPFDVQERQAS
ncbi:thiopeptide-type bacteriocin biosynthesis protein [Streptacidiphilus sp. MAP5-52]|uniref:thiopeptide-type bacteriocin biosynthesis protein n=1 Tax=Streptacidiphilus sp. MAP5-52 TaxID=3156267 RepID=UPI003519C432